MSKILLTTILVIAVFSLSVSSGPERGARSTQLSVSLTPAMALTSVEAWNSICGDWEFPEALLPSNKTTFAQAWASNGSHTMTLEQALAGATAAMNELMHMSNLDPTGDDSFNATINGWGN